MIPLKKVSASRIPPPWPLSGLATQLSGGSGGSQIDFFSLCKVAELEGWDPPHPPRGQLDPRPHTPGYRHAQGQAGGLSPSAGGQRPSLKFQAQLGVSGGDRKLLLSSLTNPFWRFTPPHTPKGGSDATELLLHQQHEDLLGHWGQRQGGGLH